MYEGMCLCAFYKLHRDSSVSLSPEKVLCCLETSAGGIFSLHNALLPANFGSTGRLHYLSYIHKATTPHILYLAIIMRKSKFIILSMFLLFLGFNPSAQVPSEKQMIGFGCWFEGRQTKQVERGFQLLSNCNLSGLKKNLNKSNSATQFFAVVTLTKLDSAGTLSLTTEELERIAKINASRKKIAFCSGCTAFYESTLNEALNRNSEIYKTANFWINQKLKELNFCRDK